MKTMASSVKESSGCSPDSTVSSLLRSCSTASTNPHSSSLIWYKGKLYSSASEALQAYIEDFDLSLTSPDVRTGKICMCQSTPKQGKLSKPHAKEKQELEDFNQEVGLGPLASLCPRQAEWDPELSSLATDDLLGFPEDGSLPFVQSTPPKPELPSGEWKRQTLGTSSCPSQTSSLNPGGSLCLQEDGKAAAPQEHHKDFSLCPPQDSASLKGSPRPLSFEELSGTLRNYPRWLTSHKSDLSVSGITSIPSLHHPVWLSSCSLSSHSTRGRDAQHLDIQGKAPSSQDSEILKERPRGNFLEQKGCLAPRGEESGSSASPGFPPESSFWRQAKKPFREDQLEGVPLDAERQLEAWPEDLAAPLEHGSPSTTDLLGAERSWEKAPGACKAAVPVCCEGMEDALSFPKADIIQKFLEDCLHDKNKLPERAEDELRVCDRERIPPTNSVQKALQHFPHLKSLAGDNSNQQKQAGDHEDKEEKKNYL